MARKKIKKLSKVLFAMVAGELIPQINLPPEQIASWKIALRRIASRCNCHPKNTPKKPPAKLPFCLSGESLPGIFNTLNITPWRTALENPPS